MSPELITALPNLSIGVVAIGAMVYIVVKFLDVLQKQTDKHGVAMRDLEKSVRQSITDQLTQASITLAENTKVLERVIRHLEK